MPSINYLNGRGNGFSSPMVVPAAYRVQNLFDDKFPGENAADFEITVNNAPANLRGFLRDGDNVLIVRRSDVQTGFADAEEVETIEVFMVDNGGRSLSETFEVEVGTTLAELIEAEAISDPEDVVITVNGGPAIADYELEDGDRVTLTPAKIDGAAATVRILLANNMGQGFADYVDTAAGTTIADFVAYHTNDADPARYTIRVNRGAVSADYVLADGDSVVITPTKIDGGI